MRLLWNWLLPPLFGFREITFGQALGLLVLCRILFGGSRWHRSPGSRIRHRLRARMERMTAEERERFRRGMGRGCFGDSAERAEPKP